MLKTQELNAEQIQAVETVEGPLLVLAGAGSGKTQVVTFRIINLLERGYPSSAILGVTFTNKAALEMRRRIQQLTDQNVLICTFHSLGAKILRESIHHLGYSPEFTIYDEEDARKLLKVCITELNLVGKKMEAKTFKSLISRTKNHLQSSDEITQLRSNDPVEKVFPDVYFNYQKKLQEYNALDFDDLLFLTVKLFNEHPSVLEMYQERYQFLLVDEYQDTNPAQYQIVKMLVAKTKNLCVVGDPDQSIYSWRGADIRNILDFEKDFPGAAVIKLEQNYRSTSTILQAANAVIQQNFNRFEKVLWSIKGTGNKIQHFTGCTEKDEVAYIVKQIKQLRDSEQIPYSDIAIFYRTNFQSRNFEDSFLLNQLPYVIVGGISFYQRKEIKDILAFLKMLVSDTDYIAFTRTINLPKRGIGEQTIDKIRRCAYEQNMSIMQFCTILSSEKSASIRLSNNQRNGINEYLQIINALKLQSETLSLRDLIEEVIEKTGYLQFLASDPETYEERVSNINELVTKAMEYEESIPSSNLLQFLEELSLHSSSDELDSDGGRIHLMTLHNSKGLEFPVVFLVGMENDLFPHANARGHDHLLEEERRLCYVGMTRAKERLYLTNCLQRNLWGTKRSQRVSRFIREIPDCHLERVEVEKSYVTSSRTSFSSDSFEKGDAVFHKNFGAGVIQEVFENSIGLTYKILFSTDQVPRDLVAKYANLVKL